MQKTHTFKIGDYELTLKEELSAECWKPPIVLGNSELLDAESPIILIDSEINAKNKQINDLQGEIYKLQKLRRVFKQQEEER